MWKTIPVARITNLGGNIRHPKYTTDGVSWSQMLGCHMSKHLKGEFRSFLRPIILISSVTQHIQCGLKASITVANQL